MKRLINRIKNILTTDLVDLDLTFFNLCIGLLFIIWAFVLLFVLPIFLISSLF